MNNLFTAAVITTLLGTNYAPVHAAEITQPETASVSTTNLTLTSSTLTDPVATAAPALSEITVGAATVQVTETPQTLQEMANAMVTDRFGTAAVASFDSIVAHESSWNLKAVNAGSGACGLGQALPCSKMADHSAAGQVTWVMDYIAERYGNPISAWNFWKAHHWY